MVVLVLAFFMGLQATLQNFRVEGPSMEPTLADGQYVLVNKVSYYHLDLARLSGVVPFWEAERGRALYPFQRPRRGEVIVFQFPRDSSEDFVKRIIAAPGDTVEIRDDEVYVNGVALEEPYVAPALLRDFPRRQLLPDEYFVLGDNRGQSRDSREGWTVPAENVIGRVWVAYWPFSRVSFF